MNSVNSSGSSKRSPLLIQQDSRKSTPQKKKVTFQLPHQTNKDTAAESFDEFKPTDKAFAPEIGNGKNLPSYRKPYGIIKEFGTLTNEYFQRGFAYNNSLKSAVACIAN